MWLTLIQMLISALGGASVMGEIVTNVGGLPKSAVTMKMPIVCVAGTNAGKVGRVRINTDGNLLFYEVPTDGKNIIIH